MERKEDRLRKKPGCSTVLPKALAEPQGALKPRWPLEPPKVEARRLDLVPTFLATMPACMGRPEKGHALEDGQGRVSFAKAIHKGGCESAAFLADREPVLLA